MPIKNPFIAFYIYPLKAYTINDIFGLNMFQNIDAQEQKIGEKYSVFYCFHDLMRL
jgi:hypothetical protein